MIIRQSSRNCIIKQVNYVIIQSTGDDDVWLTAGSTIKDDKEVDAFQFQVRDG